MPHDELQLEVPVSLGIPETGQFGSGFQVGEFEAIPPKRSRDLKAGLEVAVLVMTLGGLAIHNATALSKLARELFEWVDLLKKRHRAEPGESRLVRLTSQMRAPLDLWNASEEEIGRWLRRR